MRSPREALPIFFCACLLALGAFAWIVRGTVEAGRTRVHYEDVALSRLRELGSAETRYRSTHSRYGWLEDLQGAGLLATFEVEKDARAGAGGMLYIVSPRYRIDVLLPHMVLRSGQMAVAPRSTGRRNPDLEAGAFLLVARPWGELPGGYRTYLLDEEGRIYVSEGVSDEQAMALRPLPELHPKGLGAVITGGMQLYPLDDLPER